MPEELQPPHGAYIVTALISTFAGLGLSFFLVHIFRKRLGETKVYTTPLVVGHVIAYSFLLFGWTSGGINENAIRAGLICLSVMPAFIIASSVGRKQMVSKPLPRDDGKSGEGENEAPAPVGEAAQDKPSEDQPPQTFSEGLIRGVWAFVAIFIFYIFYFSLFGLVLQIATAISPQG